MFTSKSSKPSWKLSHLFVRVSFLSHRRRRTSRRSQNDPPGYLLTLPLELVIEIASFLDNPRDILSLSSVSNALRRVLCDPFIFRHNLCVNGWDYQAVARKAAATAALRPAISKKREIGNSEWIILARSSFDKTSVVSTVHASLPIPGTDIRKRSRQKRGRAYIRKLAELVSEHDTHNFLKLLKAFESDKTNLLDFVSSIRLVDAESRYTQSFIMAAYINWLASQSMPLPEFSGSAISSFLTWTREATGGYRREGAMLTLHTEINCVYVTSHLMLSLHSTAATGRIHSLPSYHLSSTLFDPTIVTPLPHNSNTRISDMFTWLPRVVAQWDGEITVRGFLARELGMEALTPFEMNLSFPTNPLPPSTSRYRESPRTFTGNGSDPNGAFEVVKGSLERTIGLVEFERHPKQVGLSDPGTVLSYMGCLTPFGLLGMCRGPDGLQGHFILRIESS